MSYNFRFSMFGVLGWKNDTLSKWNDIICRKVKELFMITTGVVLPACRRNNHHLKNKL
jgi:hypothetical protein